MIGGYIWKKNVHGVLFLSAKIPFGCGLESRSLLCEQQIMEFAVNFFVKPFTFTLLLWLEMAEQR